MKQMDFDIGNILYIVITLVVIIVGILGKKRKQPAKPLITDGSDSESRPGFMENLKEVLEMGREDPVFMDFSEGEPEIPAEKVVEKKPVIAKSVLEQAMEERKRFMGYEPIRQDLKYEENDTILAETDSVIEPLQVIQIEEEEKRTDYFEIARNFNAGKAIVHSAIINRIDY
jgi:hypothetical protein